MSFSGTDLSEKVTSPFFPATDTFSTTLDWFLTVEGRIGYSGDRVMVFGKGGLAATDATLKVTSTHPTHGGTASVTEFARAGPSAAALNTPLGTASSSESSTTTWTSTCRKAATARCATLASPSTAPPLRLVATRKSQP